MTTQPLILFDGVCNFCNSSVNFVLKHDKKAVIKFAPLQSFAARQLLEQYKIRADAMETFVFIENGYVYTRSTAALKVCRYLNGLWPVFYIFIIVPKVLRDGIYGYIAKNRYKWFGKREDCMVPTPDIRKRFLN